MSVQPVNSREGDEDTQLDYTVTPREVFDTLSSGHPAIATLTIGVTNNTGNDTTYIFTATGYDGGNQNKHSYIKFNPVKIDTFKANPDYGVRFGDNVTPSRKTESTTSHSISPYGITHLNRLIKQSNK